MGVETKFPVTRRELEMLAGQEPARFSATEDDYWALVSVAEYRADYYNQEIIAMSYESDNHSYLVARLLSVLFNLYEQNNACRIHGPNRPICIPACANAVFNPDGSVVAQPPVYYEYRPGMNAETTPILLFEVLSASTRPYDWNTKLPCYKKIPTLRQILFLESQRLFVSVYERVGNTNQWLNTDYENLEDEFVVNGHLVSLRQLYEGIVFAQ